MELLIESKSDLEELKQEQKDLEPDTWKLEVAAVRDPVVLMRWGHCQNLFVEIPFRI